MSSRRSLDLFQHKNQTWSSPKEPGQVPMARFHLSSFQVTSASGNAKANPRSTAHGLKPRGGWVWSHGPDLYAAPGELRRQPAFWRVECTPKINADKNPHWPRHQCGQTKKKKRKLNQHWPKRPIRLTPRGKESVNTIRRICG